jgi:hypothetical protein
MEVLTTSPLRCFPHFEDMLVFLRQSFDSREERRSAAVTTTQQATFEAEEKFCRGLFLLLQETARAHPLSPKPLRYIYKWYLQRDSIINQSRSIERDPEDEEFLVIEFADGEKLRTPKSLLWQAGVLDQGMFSDPEIARKMAMVPLDPPPPVEEVIEEGERHRPTLVCETFLTRPTKRSQQVIRPVGVSFNYEDFHAEMATRRSEDVVTRDLAQLARTRRLADISSRMGWQ